MKKAVLKQRTLAALCLLGICTLTALALIVRISLDQTKYHYYAPDAMAHWQHPTRSVVIVCVLVLVETAVIAKIIYASEDRPFWESALGAVVVLVPWWLLCSLIVMHAPGFILAHLQWLLVLIVGLTLSIARCTYASTTSIDSNTFARLRE